MEQNTSGQKVYDLEERAYRFARRVRAFVKQLPRTVGNFEDGKQVVRSSGSIGANYIEANEAVGDRDFLHRLRIARKEAKETRYWLRLVDTGDNAEFADECLGLIQEADELLRILSAIIKKCELHSSG